MRFQEIWIIGKVTLYMIPMIRKSYLGRISGYFRIPEFILSMISGIFLSENGKLGLKLKIWKCLGIEPIPKYGSNIPGIYIDTYFRFLAHHVIDELIDEINDEPVKIKFTIPKVKLTRTQKMNALRNSRTKFWPKYRSVEV